MQNMSKIRTCIKCKEDFYTKSQLFDIKCGLCKAKFKKRLRLSPPAINLSENKQPVVCSKPKKQPRCLKCERFFKSEGAHNRLCYDCNMYNSMFWRLHDNRYIDRFWGPL